MSPRFALAFASVFLCSLQIHARDIEAPRGAILSFPKEQWEHPPEEFLRENWDAEALVAAEKKWGELRDAGMSTGMMVVHRGYVIREFGDCETPVACHSVRKSFLSAIFGAWIEKNGTDIAELLETTVSDLSFSEIGGIPPEYQSVTIRQMLQSSSGVPLPAEYESKKNFESRMKTRALPGERWAYSNWDFNALGTAFNRLSGGDLFEVFDRTIAGPLGMQGFDIKKHKEYFPRKGRKKKSLHPAYLFKLSARDRARLGLLYLSGGVWEDKRIINKEWFEHSITDTIPTNDSVLDYGYMWWVGVNGQKRYSFPGDRTYSARGNGGQYIFIIPSRDLIVVSARDTGQTRSDTDFDGGLFNKVFHKVADAQRPLFESDPLAFFEKCESLVPQLQEEYHVPGVALALVENGEVVRSREFGLRNSETGEEVTAATRFEAASMSKPLFAYGVMKLVEQGTLDLDRPLVEYIKEPYMKNDDRHRKITARMVLSHRSGFPNWRKGGVSRNTEPPGLGFEPGTDQRYSGEGFTLLQKAVGEITGLNLDEFTRQKLLVPMGMKQSRYIWDDTFEIAAAHNDDGSLRRSNPRYLTGNSAYTLFTTATDYAQFLIEMMKQDRGGAHSLSDESIDMMLQSHSEPGDKRNFALSWIIRPESQGGYSHTGSNSGFRCGAWFDPEKNRGIVIMTNSIGGEELRDRIFETALGSW